MSGSQMRYNLFAGEQLVALHGFTEPSRFGRSLRG